MFYYSFKIGPHFVEAVKPEWSSLGMILKKFLKFLKSEPHDSYKLDSYFKKSVYKIEERFYTKYTAAVFQK